MIFAAMSGTQAGDPAKEARVMIEVAEVAEPPLYLLWRATPTPEPILSWTCYLPFTSKGKR